MSLQAMHLYKIDTNSKENKVRLNILFTRERFIASVPVLQRKEASSQEETHMFSVFTK